MPIKSWPEKLSSQLVNQTRTSTVHYWIKEELLGIDTCLCKAVPLFNGKHNYSHQLR